MIYLVCSAGGHLTQLIGLAERLRKLNEKLTFITYDNHVSRELSKKYKVNFVINPERNIFKYVLCLLQTATIFAKIQPSKLITNGAGVCLPAFF